MEIKEQIIVLVKSKKSKTINIKEIRENLNLEYTPQNEKILKNEIEKLVQERYIEPQKTSKTNVEGISEKYKIIKQDDANIKQEIINLSNKLKIDYYLKNTKEYQKDKEIINSISKFISKPIEGVLTINERSYQIFQNEKLLKEREDIIKRLGLTLQDLKCYETYEPFFYYENKEFSKGKILIIENKDTFWTIQNVVKTTKYKNIYLVIYGEGKKILKSFEFINNFKLENNIIEYFGDIDYEGINIYEQLKSKYSQYNIKAYKTGYQKILDIEKNPNKIRANQICNLKNNEEFLKENLHMCELAITFLKKYVYDVLENTGKYSVSYDIWEENDRGIHMYSLASIFSAFDTMKKIYKALGKNVSDFENNRLKEEKINKNIKEIDELMLKVKEYIEQNLYDENRKSYVRNTEDRRIDISLLGAVYPFNVFSPKEKKVLNTVENINLTLRTYTGGYQRYENDGYRNGSPWPISNLWMTLYYLEIGEKKKAKETFDFVLKTVGKHSFLGEQVDNSTLKPNWVIGLGWSHAMFIIVLEKLSNIK